MKKGSTSCIREAKSKRGSIKIVAAVSFCRCVIYLNDINLSIIDHQRIQNIFLVLSLNTNINQ